MYEYRLALLSHKYGVLCQLSIETGEHNCINFYSLSISKAFMHKNKSGINLYVDTFSAPTVSAKGMGREIRFC